jgi:hypothetical protein
MTSLDELCLLTTIEEMRRLAGRVSQVIILSRSKPFLCALWEGTDPRARSALRINREGAGSTLAAWDVHQDCITEHDERHALVSADLQLANAANERAVVQALRPILKAYLPVAYPPHCPPGALLGGFIDNCR